MGERPTPATSAAVLSLSSSLPPSLHPLQTTDALLFSLTGEHRLWSSLTQLSILPTLLDGVNPSPFTCSTTVNGGAGSCMRFFLAS